MLPFLTDKNHILQNPILHRGNLTQDNLEILAQNLSALIQGGDTIALYGDLGAGKSTFARAFLRALGITEDIPSPTFTLVQTYDTPRFTAHHADLYRLSDPSEVVELGIADPMPDAVRLIEWPDKAVNLLPQDSLWLCLGFTENMEHRNLTVHGNADWAQRLRNI